MNLVKSKLGRATIDEEGKIIGTGGYPFATEFLVETKTGKKVGMATKGQVDFAYKKQISLNPFIK